jgi:hypothetical protein
VNELAVVSLGFGILGGVIGYFLTREVVKNIGVPMDERRGEIAKLAALKTLEFVLLVTVLSFYYCIVVAEDGLCSAILSGILAAIFFGNLTMRAYYSKKL